MIKCGPPTERAAFLSRPPPSESILRFIVMLIRARISGDYKRTPLFSPRTGAPVATPKILSQTERAALLNAL